MKMRCSGNPWEVLSEAWASDVGCCATAKTSSHTAASPGGAIVIHPRIPPYFLLNAIKKICRPLGIWRAVAAIMRVRFVPVGARCNQVRPRRAGRR
jgi:hypothetical protein